MARVRFVGADETCEVFRHVFPRFEWVSKHKLETDELDRLANNPQFEVEGHVVTLPEDHAPPDTASAEAAAERPAAAQPAAQEAAPAKP